MSSRIAGYLCKAPSRVSGEASMESAEVVMAREGLLPPDGAPLLAPLLASFPTEPFGRVNPEMVGIFIPCPFNCWQPQLSLPQGPSPNFWINENK